MKYIKKFNEQYEDIKITPCEKSKKTYEFISKYLDTIDIESYMNNEHLYQICAYSNDELIGISIYRMKDNKIHMNYSAVKEEFRNKGLNKKMKMEIIKIGKENNCDVITANVRESNIPSLTSLLNIGFEINKNVDIKYPDGEKKIPVYLKLK